LIVLAVITFVGATDLAETELSLESHLGCDSSKTWLKCIFFHLLVTVFSKLMLEGGASSFSKMTEHG